MIKMTDVKVLWGKAANRCAFPDCRIELTTEGATGVLGEMAHIVAESTEGARGSELLTLAQRNEYPNLILLCPTHHRIIDTQPDIWPGERLHQLKQEHERWVSAQLERGSIIPHSIDNSAFLSDQKNKWLHFATNDIWIISSITPLHISEDIIDPITVVFQELLNNVHLPNDRHIANNSTVNHYDTSPNEYGLVNEDLKRITSGIGHRIQIFRNGHCEFLICLEKGTRQTTEYALRRDSEELDRIRVIRYTDIAKCIINQINELKRIWDAGLPFNDMLITVLITNTESTRLYSEEGAFFEDCLGRRITLGILEHNSVFNRNDSALSIIEIFIKRFVNYFGLVLDNVFTDTGELIRPGFLHS